MRFFCWAIEQRARAPQHFHQIDHAINLLHHHYLLHVNNKDGTPAILHPPDDSSRCHKHSGTCTRFWGLFAGQVATQLFVGNLRH
ncbi:hypothetical protein FH972_011018 [Carpinus fangiana]|uniref:Uncharacterized protein n=1 Tax=Carpinus fangiana TaxID=176857 RepID=A0A660KQ13_9ROSI|nr:hypothetical protein FH972_011018 [Carpinus fangiana]